MTVLRVLFLTRKWPPAVGGMEICSAEIARELSKIVDLYVVNLPGRPDGRPPAPAHVIGFGLKAMFKLALRRSRYDAVLIGDLAMSFFALWLRMTGYRGHVLVAAHGTDIAFTGYPGLKPRLYALMIRLMALAEKSITAVIANSRATAERCRKAGFRRIAIVPLGVRAVNVTSGGHPPSNNLVFVGRVAPSKGLSWFVNEVLPHLDPSIKLRVVGTFWSETEKQVLDKNDRVILVGHRTGEDLIRERANALAVIMPNITVDGHEFEGFGLSAVEASAQGGVLLAACFHGLKDAVIDGRTGFLLPSGDAPAWIDKIHEIAGWDRATRMAFVSRSVTETLSSYDWVKTAWQYVTLMEPGFKATKPGPEPKQQADRAQG